MNFTLLWRIFVDYFLQDSFNLATMEDFEYEQPVSGHASIVTNLKLLLGQAETFNVRMHEQK